MRIGGIGVVYGLGIPWLAAVTGMGLTKATLGSMVFIPGDLIKAILAGSVAAGVRRAYPIAPK